MAASLALILASAVVAASNNATATPKTPQFQGWTPEPDFESGTASVIWECITTIGLCTYAMIHVNISSVPLGKFATFIRKCIVVLTGLLFPEVWAWGAVSQLIEARNLVKASKRMGHGMGPKQAFFVYSGGFAIRDLQDHVPSVKAEDLWGREVFVDGKSLWYRSWKTRVSDKEIVMFAMHVPSDEEIDDRSKQDGLVKAVTSLQALWFLVQVAARGQQGLLIAPMQVGTLAYVSMAAFIYSCWWCKAYDAKSPCVLEGSLVVKDGEPQIDLEAWYAAEDRRKFKGLFSSLKIGRMRFLRPLMEPFYQAMKASAYDVYHITAVLAYKPAILGALTSIFTAIHCVAWYYPSPTTTEALLWRIFTCGGIAVGPWAFAETTRFSSGVWWRSGGKTWALGYVVYEVLWGVFSLLYLLSRLYVMVESFIAFRGAPKSVYQQVNWCTYVPHYGC